MKTETINNRIDLLDYLRGFALIGILLINVPTFLVGPEPPLPKSIDESYQRFLYLFVEGRFYTIFTFLFGIGSYIFITRALAKNYNAYLLFIRRLVVLFVMGIPLAYLKLDHGGVLCVYAVFGILLIPFYKVNKHVNLILALLGIVSASYLSDKELLIFPLFLLGLTAGQYRIFEKISNNKWKYRILIFTVIALILSIVGLRFQYKYVSSFNTFIDIGITIGPIVSASYVGILIIFLQYKWVQKILYPLKNYGRMGFTNYLSQAILVKIFYYYFPHITWFQTLFLCIGIYAIQFACNMVWFQYFKIGPFEWIWRKCTYWKVALNKKLT